MVLNLYRRASHKKALTPNIVAGDSSVRESPGKERISSVYDLMVLIVDIPTSLLVTFDVPDPHNVSVGLSVFVGQGYNLSSL